MRPFQFFGFLTFVTIVLIIVSALIYQVLTIYSIGALSFIPKAYLSIAVAAPILLLISMVIGRDRYHKAVALTYTITMFWISILLWLFTASLILAPLSIVLVQNDMTMLFTTVLSIVFVGIIVTIFVGIWNGWDPKVVSHQFKIPVLAPLWKDKRIVLFSDSHLGMVRNKKFLKKIVSLVNAQSPDLVLIAGDLIDGPALKYEEVLAPLSEIKSTFGVFFTSGNHDQYNMHPEQYYGVLQKHVTILDDAKVTVNNTELIGIAYGNELPSATQERLKKSLYDADKPAIAVLHDPKNAEALADAGIPLILSGHTHGGQFFPITWLVKGLYRNRTKGTYQVKETLGFTSVGVGTGGPLLRLGTQPEIAVITIEE